ncbi:TRAP transporter substrate-binding protein [Aminipila sp.]|uniref:TRAP transporter substrate-binding protein n=1 Tax=Aminipila sp. TaxID=2060095 RepID=UPI00289D2487|nr:TRAP transporter substrate-binding protein [Aminipila sp.]
MKKKTNLVLVLCLCVALIAGLAGCGSGGSKADGQEVYEISITHLASESDPIHQGWLLLKDTLEEKSDGRFKVTIYPNKQISNSDNENAEKVQQGICQVSSVPTSSLASLGSIKEYQIFDYPYLFESNEELYTVLDSDLAKTWSAKLNDATGVTAFGGYNLGWCKIGSNKKVINSPADLKGQKIRTMSSDLQMAIINSLGANATVVNYGELFTACQQGTVDGMMTSTGLFLSDRFYEVQKYLACTDALGLLHVPIVNTAWYESLPEDLKAVFDESMGIYLDGVRQYEEDYEAAALDKLKENGMQVREYTAEEIQSFKDATASVYTAKANVAGQDTIDAVKEILGKK